MKVMFATDGSEYAAKAAKLLTEMEALQPLDLSVVTVTYEPPVSDSTIARPWYKDFREQNKERVAEHFHSLKDLLSKAAKNVNMLHLHGQPAQQLLDIARKEKPDLLVVGARGHSMLDSLLLGSVSESVAFHAPCSVLVLRAKEGAEETKSAGPHVTLAFDDSIRAKSATVELSRLQWPAETRMEILGAEEAPSLYYGYGITPNDLQAYADATMRLQGVEKYLGERFPNVTSYIAHAAHIGESIVERCRKTNTDLLMVGDSGRNGLERWLLGSTTKYVLRHAPCSVWISRYPSVEAEKEFAPYDMTSQNADSDLVSP